MPEMTKKEFAARLLFWLLPWPISRALPRALRIYYFGPSGGPPPGWYDYFGIPQWFWEDVPSWEDFFEDPPDEPPPWWPPDVPPYDEFIDDLPEEEPPWWPIDPYNPPPPDQFPDLPDGPVNPSDPYIPGPGGKDPSHPAYPAGWNPYLDDTYWETEHQATWDTDHWDFKGDFAVSIREIGTWAAGFRPTKWRVTHNYGAGLHLALANAGEPGWAFEGIVVSGQEYDLDFSGASDADITVIEHDAGEEGCDFDITNIEFYS